jgi:hypothetical protein
MSPGFPWGSEENREIMRQDYLPSSRDSKAGPKNMNTVKVKLDSDDNNNNT